MLENEMCMCVSVCAHMYMLFVIFYCYEWKEAGK